MDIILISEVILLIVCIFQKKKTHGYQLLLFADVFFNNT